MILSRLFSSYTNYFKAAAWGLKGMGSSTESEDAYLIGPKILALCDGLGAWKSRNIDAGIYSTQLISNIEKSHISLPDEEKYHPQSILRQAVKNTTEIGSSTCILVTIHPEKPQLYCGCVGDSGMILLRKKDNEIEIVAQTPEVCEKFDKPYTLGTEGKSPDDGFYNVYEVLDKDIVLLYSDGVSHNMFADHIVRMVRPFMMLLEIPDLEIIAEMITEKAQSNCSDENMDKPYGVEIHDRKMGKINDTTVVIAEIRLKNIN